ncbi:hypothetical protein Tco_1234686 [Tanacetum coccineum]
MFDEPLGDDSKPRSYDVTFSNSLFDFNDDYTLCYDNPLFDDELEDISIMDPPKSAPLNYEPLGNPDSVSRSLDTSDLNLEELTAEIGLDDSIPTEIDDGYYDSEGDILFLEHLLIEETFSDPTPAVCSIHANSNITYALIVSRINNGDQLSNMSVDVPNYECRDMRYHKCQSKAYELIVKKYKAIQLCEIAVVVGDHDLFMLKDLSDEYYTKKFCKVNKEDRQDDDELRRQLQDDCNQCRYQGNVIEQHIFPSRELSFNQSGIIGVSFALSSQGFSSPKGFNIYTFIAENYFNFPSGPRRTDTQSSSTVVVVYSVLEHVLMLETYTRESVPLLHKISRSRSPAKRERSTKRVKRRSSIPRRNRALAPPSKGRKRSPSPKDGSLPKKVESLSDSFKLEKIEGNSKFIMDVSNHHGSTHKRRYSSVPGSLSSVVDAYFSSDNSNNSWAFASSVASSPEPPFKKNRAQKQQMRLTPVNRVSISVLSSLNKH